MGNDQSDQDPELAQLDPLQASEFTKRFVGKVVMAIYLTEQQKRELQPIIRQKRDNLLLKHRSDEVQAVEAQ